MILFLLLLQLNPVDIEHLRKQCEALTIKIYENSKELKKLQELIEQMEREKKHDGSSYCNLNAL